MTAEQQHQPSSDHAPLPEWETSVHHDFCDTCGWPVSRGDVGTSWVHEPRNPMHWTDKRSLESQMSALHAERDRHMDAEPAGVLDAQRQSEVIADLSKRINALADKVDR